MMAGDWIKMRTDLYRDPKVCAIADHLMHQDGELSAFVNQNCQRKMTVTRNVMRNVTVGALVSVWGVMRLRGKRIDDDLVFKSGTLWIIDDLADLPGFGQAMASVGWVEANSEGIVFRNFFSEYNVDPNEDAKAKNAERQRRHREKSKQERNVTDDVTGASQSNAREEKRREEISKEDTHTLSTPQGCVSDFEKQKPTQAAECAMAMKRGGIGAVSPQHPELLAMVKAGVAPEQFEQAAQAATAKSKGFAYALGILKGQLREANEIASDGLTMPTKPWDESRTTIESEGERLGLGRWDEAKWSVGQGKSFAEYTKSVAQARETMEVA